MGEEVAEVAAVEATVHHHPVPHTVHPRRPVRAHDMDRPHHQVDHRRHREALRGMEHHPRQEEVRSDSQHQHLPIRATQEAALQVARVTAARRLPDHPDLMAPVPVEAVLVTPDQITERQVRSSLGFYSS